MQCAVRKAAILCFRPDFAIRSFPALFCGQSPRHAIAQVKDAQPAARIFVLSNAGWYLAALSAEIGDRQAGQRPCFIIGEHFFMKKFFDLFPIGENLSDII